MPMRINGNQKRKAIEFLATGGLIGFAPAAPGTFGSLAALPLCLLLSGMSIEGGVIFLVALISVSVWIAHAAEKLIGRNDPKQVVIDEICGMAVALFALPFTPLNVCGGFALFRVFDILKPFPIRWADRNVSGGLGIVLDDIIAGVIANALMRTVIHFI
jgi:phosphatidylglycerophosphatase A